MVLDGDEPRSLSGRLSFAGVYIRG